MKKLILDNIQLRDTHGKIFFTGLVRVEYLEINDEPVLEIINTIWENGEFNKNWIFFVDSWTKIEILNRIKAEQ